MHRAYQSTSEEHKQWSPFTLSTSAYNLESTEDLSQVLDTKRDRKTRWFECTWKGDKQKLNAFQPLLLKTGMCTRGVRMNGDDEEIMENKDYLPGVLWNTQRKCTIFPLKLRPIKMELCFHTKRDAWERQRTPDSGLMESSWAPPPNRSKISFNIMVAAPGIQDSQE